MLGGHPEDGETEPAGECGTVARPVIGGDEQHARSGHQRGAEKGVLARLLVIAVDECEPGMDATQRLARRLAEPWEMGIVPGELDDGAKKRGRENVG